MTTPTTADYDIRVDWGGDATFGPAPDDVSDDVLGNPGLTVEYGRDAARSLSPPMVGAADFSLLNEDKTYSPEYAGSPLYQLLRPGKAVRVIAQHGEGALWRSNRLWREPAPYRGIAPYYLFTGALDTLEQHPEYGGRSVGLGCLGSAAKLLLKVITVPVYSSITTGQAVGLILDAAGWSATKRVTAIGDTTLRYFWSDERPAWDALLEVLASEGAGALLYEDAEGYIRFENRNFRTSNPRSLAPQATFSDYGGGYSYTAIRYTPHWEDVVGRVTLPIKQRELDAALSVVWELGTAISLNVVGQPVTITARPTDPFLGAISPVAGTDYTVSGGTATVALTEATGRVAKITLTDTSGSPVISGLQLRAQALRSVGETIIEASPQNPPYEKTLELKAWPEIDPNQAQSIANSAYARYGNAIPRVEIDVINADGDHMLAQLDARISDRITIVNDHLGLSSDFYIEKIRHAVTTGGRHVTTFTCEQVTALGSLGGALWDSAIWDTSIWGL